ncbi:hypothetical protein DsansV1_C10g0100871 [Dioscorea sansibarensis]
MGGEGRGESQATAVSLGPGVGGRVVDDGGAVAIDGGGALEEGERGESAAVRRVGAETIHAVLQWRYDKITVGVVFTEVVLEGTLKLTLIGALEVSLGQTLGILLFKNVKIVDHLVIF